MEILVYKITLDFSSIFIVSTGRTTIRPRGRKDPMPDSAHPEKRVTHQDIAKALGVSKTTVSLALRNHPRITEAVRDKIKQKAEELGYTPDPMLSALAKYSQARQEKHDPLPLAFLNLQPDPQLIHRNEEFILYLKGAEKMAEELGYRLEEFALAELRAERLDTILKTRSIRGLLLSPGDYSHPVDWGAFPWKDYAAVRLGRSENAPLTHFVTSAQSTNAVIALDAIWAKGYKRIGLVTRHRRRRLFGAGFFWGQYPLPEEQQVPLLAIPWERSVEEKEDLFKTWFSRYRPDAVLSDSELNLPALLHRMGRRIPEDIALASTTIHPSQINAGIDQNPAEIGRAAVRILAGQLNQQQFGIPAIRSEILIEGRWVDGTMLPKR